MTLILPSYLSMIVQNQSHLNSPCTERALCIVSYQFLHTICSSSSLLLLPSPPRSPPFPPTPPHAFPSPPPEIDLLVDKRLTANGQKCEFRPRSCQSWPYLDHQPDTNDLPRSGTTRFLPFICARRHGPHGRHVVDKRHSSRYGRHNQSYSR